MCQRTNINTEKYFIKYISYRQGVVYRTKHRQDLWQLMGRWWKCILSYPRREEEKENLSSSYEEGIKTQRPSETSREQPCFQKTVETSSKLTWKSKCNLNKKRGFSQVNLLGFSFIFLFGPTLALNSFPLITDFPPQKVNNLAHQVHSKETSRKKAWCLAARVKIDCS